MNQEETFCLLYDTLCREQCRLDGSNNPVTCPANTWKLNQKETTTTTKYQKFNFFALMRLTRLDVANGEPYITILFKSLRPDHMRAITTVLENHGYICTECDNTHARLTFTLYPVGL